MTKQEVLEKLYNYFEYKTSSLLEILDTPSETAAVRGGYTGVTAGYLMKYVVPGIDKSTFLECINQLMDEKIVARLTCADISRLVFEKYHSDYGHSRLDSNSVTMYDLERSGISMANNYKTDEYLNEEE